MHGVYVCVCSCGFVCTFFCWYIEDIIDLSMVFAIMVVKGRHVCPDVCVYAMVLWLGQSVRHDKRVLLLEQAIYFQFLKINLSAFENGLLIQTKLWPLCFCDEADAFQTNTAFRSCLGYKMRSFIITNTFINSFSISFRGEFKHHTVICIPKNDGAQSLVLRDHLHEICHYYLGIFVPINSIYMICFTIYCAVYALGLSKCLWSVELKGYEYTL